MLAKLIKENILDKNEKLYNYIFLFLADPEKKRKEICIEKVESSR